MAWLDEFTVVVSGEPSLAQAKAVKTYLASAEDVASLLEVRSHPGGAEMLVMDVRTGAPQRPVVQIERVERVGLLFGRADAMPFVLMLRDDFPDTEHQHLVPEGVPAAICIDDRPWDEARLTWTPAEMLQRIHLWFWRAARGQLHDAHQPLDPFFGLSEWEFIVPACVMSGEDGAELVVFLTNQDHPHLVTVLPRDAAPNGGQACHLTPVAYTVPPEKMSRLRRAPSDLASLAKLLLDRGVDIVADLKVRMRTWAGSEDKDRSRMNGVLAIIVAMPVIVSNGEGKAGLLDLRVFITMKTVGEIGVALGELFAHSDATASGFARAIASQECDRAALRDCPVEMGQIHRAFEPDLASALAGRTARDSRKVVLVGAGAIGSHVSEYLVREGRFSWTVIDDDRMLPHNVARHTLRAIENGQAKACALANRLNAIFQPTAHSAVASFIDANVLRPRDKEEAVERAFSEASVIIDASASVAVSRHLADLETSGRRASVFFNPSAEAVVALVEPEDRSLTLRDLEAQYYRAVLQRPELERHLTAVGERFAYTGACRAVTNRVPESRVALLSSLAACGLAQALDRPEASMRVWTTDVDGRVAVSEPRLGCVTRHRRGDWEITVDAEAVKQMFEMRDRSLPRETGGSLIGILDSLARKIHLVEALVAPPDSKESPGGFERGIAGLTNDVAGKLTMTMDQTRYVGEWHSHPRDYPLAPSTIDIIQLSVSAVHSSLEDVPVLSFIVGDDGLNVLVGKATPV